MHFFFAVHVVILEILDKTEKLNASKKANSAHYLLSNLKNVTVSKLSQVYRMDTAFVIEFYHSVYNIPTISE